MTLRNTCILAGFILATSWFCVESAKPKGASLTLKARFNATSYLLETVEFLADEDAYLVWDFLDLISGSGTGYAELDDGTCWRFITDRAAQLLSPSVGKLIPLTLGVRQYAAKLQMIRQLAEQFHPEQMFSHETSCCFVSVDGAVATTPQILSDLLNGIATPYSSYSESEQLFSFDHIFPGEVGGPKTDADGGSAEIYPRVAILYGSPGLPCFSPLYEELKRVASNPDDNVIFAFRPLLTAACEPFSGCARAGTGGQLLLPGWGVEAALKNTEYSAMDDKEVSRQQQQGGSEEDESGTADFGTGDAAVVKGFRLDVLAARRPQLRQELLTFRDQLRAADDDEAALKVWDLRDVGLQATQRILGSSDPLALLAELSQNFPGIVSSLSRQSVSSSLKSAVTHNQQFVSAGANFLLLNGLAVDVNDFDFFAFLTRLRSEMRLRDTLVGPPLELPSELAKQVMALRAEESAHPGPGGGEEAEPRLNLGSSSAMVKHVAFLNDLERDSRYQRYGRNLGDLLNTFPGRLRPLARNVFTAVLVTEPLCSESLELVMNIERMWEGGYPIRFGVVFNLPSVVSRVGQQRKQPHLRSGVLSWAEMDASERFGRGFATLKEAFGPAAAWKMWTDAAEAVASGYFEEPKEVVEMAFKSAWEAAARSPPPGARAKAASRKSPSDAFKMLKDGAGYAAEVGMQLSETASWLLAKGLVQPPAAKAGERDADKVAAADDLGQCTAPPIVWVNGLTAKAGGSQPAEDIMYKVMGEMQRMQEAVYFGRIDDRSGGGDVLVAILQMHGSVERLNQRLVGPRARSAQVLNLAPMLNHPAHDTLRALYRNAGSRSSVLNVASVTHYIAADLSNEAGRELAAEALRFLSEVLPASSASNSRLVLVANPVQPEDAPSLLELLVQAGIRQLDSDEISMDKVVAFLTKLLTDSTLVARLSGELATGSSEETLVAMKYAENAGLDSKSIRTFLIQVVDESLTEQGTMRGGTPSMSYRITQSDLCRSVFRLEAGAAAVISNGRVTPVYTPNGESHELLAEDLELLQIVTSSGLAAAISKTLLTARSEGLEMERVPADLPDDAASNVLSELSAVLTSALASACRVAAPEGGSGGSSSKMSPGASLQMQNMMSMLRRQAVEVPGGPDAPFHIEAVLNPLSRPAQRLTAVLLLLREALGPSMSLTLNPQRDITEMPLKSYYRYALPTGLALGGGPPGPPTAYFSRLPGRRVLTLNLDAPEAWLVEPAAALYDLDNLRLEDVAGEVAFAEFELDALMLTGSCVDVTASGRMTPPRGLQLHLGTQEQPHRVDTLVMANLAYFQLKAAPGRWLLSLAPGRSRDLYLLQSSTGTSLEAFSHEGEEGAAAAADQSSDDVSTQVLISSFMGKHMILRVRKRPGMEAEDVLQEDGPADDSYDTWDPSQEDDEYMDDDEKPPSSPTPTPSGGIIGKVSSLIMGAGSKAGAAQQDAASKKARQLRGGDTINVFTVASGHMYERLQKIMILSVLRHTKSRVKFWIIKNYMSPQHKQVIPALAERFGFDYEFVTYKWPHWLHKQTDKQRLIWAYKILFLDVLFPLSVDRIIFVDSDQVVRSDLAELYHMDLKGAPYAYTPFCDNNKEMDEYRFWKGGFWRDHLQGKPYHISALYLVDLKRFRQIAAGDQLRVVYDQLSKDPNSLANLDQDLPNYAQHSIRIFSLPQEWLWCESWCGNATKAKAKTIDLCNNPKTKEPKLTAARRIIGGLWEMLDKQQEDVTRMVQSVLEAGEEVGPAGSVSAPAAGQFQERADADVATELTELSGQNPYLGVDADLDADVSEADASEARTDKTEL
ncbi:hypothetical protein Vafri_5482 [Volvox africanus]|uniref:UDP-glucose:glycoprotein glucosyltransferase n=1 Tax=Volvox africanus TaxID=51714 RepID=A0A8J4AWG6_9CHLO|nr:hypothetical protein Vafri_5482 [Volvox africanus]